MVKIMSILMFIVFLSIVFLLHFYVYSRIRKILGINKLIIIAGLAVLTLGFILMEIIERKVTGTIINLLYPVFADWIGVFGLLIGAFLVLDVLYLILKLAGVPLSYQLLGRVFLILTVVVAGYSLYNAQQIKITRTTLKFDNLDRDYRIVHLSDLHVKGDRSIPYLKKVVGLVNGLKPDMVLITGDLFDEGSSRDDDYLAALKDLKSKYGTYFVTGNHENYFGADRAVSLIQRYNVTVLRNKTQSVAGITLIGIDYPQDAIGGKPKMPANLTAGDGFKLLLYHGPQFLNYSINLQLSGHVHNGQLFPNWLIVKLLYKYPVGLHKIRENSYIYVSQGTGTWGPKMRVPGYNEIALIELLKR